MMREVIKKILHEFINSKFDKFLNEGKGVRFFEKLNNDLRINVGTFLSKFDLEFIDTYVADFIITKVKSHLNKSRIPFNVTDEFIQSIYRHINNKIQKFEFNLSRPNRIEFRETLTSIVNSYVRAVNDSIEPIEEIPDPKTPDTHSERPFSLQIGNESRYQIWSKNVMGDTHSEKIFNLGGGKKIIVYFNSHKSPRRLGKVPKSDVLSTIEEIENQVFNFVKKVVNKCESPDHERERCSFVITDYVSKFDIQFWVPKPPDEKTVIIIVNTSIYHKEGIIDKTIKAPKIIITGIDKYREVAENNLKKNINKIIKYEWN